MELTGKIKLINSPQTFESGFVKREFVVTTTEQYPQDIKLELIKEKCALLDNFLAGNDVKVSFNLRGNEYQGKYFVNLQAWKIEGIASAPSAPQQASNGQASEDTGNPLPPEDDDLPF